MNKEFALIHKIQEVRAKNNELWMSILRTAMDANPIATKKLLSDISENDTKITELTKQIAGM